MDAADAQRSWPVDLSQQNEFVRDFLPGYLGLEFTEFGERTVSARLPVQQHHMAPNGYLHAATVVALADTAAGFGCRTNLPDGAQGFTTIDLTCSYLGTATDGAIACVAEMVHGGRTTQVWDVKVRREGDDRTIALFRCTQLVIYPRS